MKSRPTPSAPSSPRSRRTPPQEPAKAKLLSALGKALKASASEDIGFARIDHARETRKGFPEVVFGPGKTPGQLLAITRRILNRSGRILITRVDAVAAAMLLKEFPTLEYHAVARAVFQSARPAPDRNTSARKLAAPQTTGRQPAGRRANGRRPTGSKSSEGMPSGVQTSEPSTRESLMRGHVLILTAGTGDIPVAEEAALTARLLGCKVETIYDVGVAGLHRLLAQLPRLKKASVIVTVAGMEGALPSVVAGLVDKPVIGVPTSIGYGASLGGLSALLGMLNSCASGLTVVNIDNGFGAGFAAAQMLRLAQRAGAARRKT